MNRTQKKCVLASAGFHLSLLLILFFGTSLLSSKEQFEDRPLLDFIPLKTIDEALSGGGNPTPPPQQPTPTPPAPRPAPPRQQPVQQPEPPKPVEQKSDTFDTKPTKHVPKVYLKLKSRSSDNQSTKPTPVENSKTKTVDRQTELTKAAREFERNVREGLSSSTEIELSGPGGGGVPYANFLDAVKKFYTEAWVVPPGVTDDSATTTASVTIARDGRVVDAHIIGRSGNGLADQSVEAVLRRVTRVVPLPEGAKEDQRTVHIKFSVRAKLLG